MTTTIDGGTGIDKVKGGFVNPPPGALGEFLSAAGSSVALANVTPVNGCSLLIPAGIWDVQAGATFDVVTGPCIHRIACLGAVSNTLSGTSANAANNQTVGYGDTVNTPIVRLVLAAPTMYYCIVRAAFSGGSVTASSSYINARRVA